MKRNVTTASINNDRVVATDTDTDSTNCEGPDSTDSAPEPVIVRDGETMIQGTAATVTIELNPDARLVGSKPLDSLETDQANRLALREALAIATDGNL